MRNALHNTALIIITGKPGPGKSAFEFNSISMIRLVFRDRALLYLYIATIPIQLKIHVYDVLVVNRGG